ncbi:MAG TPA: cytochrome c3 family protein, partial [Gammaproteobacteria bacterium]|nr:cytochrome c3 family protein [Gammaproteobacteria bacterium]
MTTWRWRRWSLALALVAGLAAVLYGFAMIRNGFGALDEPSQLEVVLARAVRDLGIPSRARAELNPLTATPELLEEARELYVARCADCHGHPGGNRSDIGHKLYPRATDLASAEAQRLTDGELHYIIENGIRLTGMPAWRDADAGRAIENWKLVLLIRSLAPPGDAAGLRAGVDERRALGAEYVGSAACRDCHTQIYDRWIETPMANILVDVREHPEAILGDFTTPNPLVTFSRDDIAFTYGSLWKQRYFTRIGDDYFVFPAQWDVMNRVWRRYYVAPGTDWWVEHYPADQMQRPTGPLCDGCHSTNYDVRTKTVTEWNVGCEKCHGPGSLHVEQASRTSIVNPAHMNHVAANDVCVQCHSQGQPLDNPIEGRYYDWPVGYEVGRALADYWHLEEHALGAETFTHYADGSAHKNRMQGNDFVQSTMYQHGVTCASCHDAHGTEHYAQLRKPAQALCLDCHGPGSVNGPYTATLEAHTQHPPDSAGSQCIACHMPQTAATIADVKVRSHTFRFVTPEMTERYGIPNGCTSCHAEETNGWAQQA